MPDRVIFHADCNNFYASCECLERPELKDVPMAVAGDPENRVGVVVAKNELAKKYGVKTTDTVYQAKKKCPGIVFVPPRHSFYSKISQRVNAIYLEYTDYVQIRRPDMTVISRQTSLGHYTFLQREIQEEAFALVRKHWNIGPAQPIRALTVGVAKLCPADQVVEQMSLFDLGEGKARREKQEKLEALVDALRNKHGEGSITLGYQENKEIGVERGEGRR